MVHRRRSLLALLVVALVAAIGAVVTATPASAATNLVVNGTFAAGTTNWTWHALGGVESCCAAPPSGYPNAYAHPDGTKGNITSWQHVGTPAAGNYRLSGKIRTSGGVQKAWLQADDGATKNRRCETTRTNTATWTTFSCDFTIGAGSPVRVAMIAKNAVDAAWGWVSFDDISLVRTGGGNPTTFDLAAYMMRTDGTNGGVYRFTSGETMQIQYDSSNGRYYQVKNSNWEEMGFTSSYVVRYRDTSPNDVEWYGLYTGTSLGSNWAPRHMSVGQSYDRNPVVRFYRKDNCSLTQGPANHFTTIKLEAHHPSTVINGYTVSDVIHLRGYADGVKWEDFYYARGIGLVRFIAYDIYQPGQPVIRDFMYNGSGGNQPTRMGLCNP